MVHTCYLHGTLYFLPFSSDWNYVVFIALTNLQVDSQLNPKADDTRSLACLVSRISSTHEYLQEEQSYIHNSKLH